jgi:hypothetical protein
MHLESKPDCSQLWCQSSWSNVISRRLYLPPWKSVLALQLMRDRFIPAQERATYHRLAKVLLPGKRYTVHCTIARLTEEIPGTGLSCVVPTPAEAAAVCVFRCRPLPLRRALTGTACQILRSAASADPRPDRGAASTPDPGPQPTGSRSSAPASPKGLQRCHQPVNPERFSAYKSTSQLADIQLWVGT